MHTRILSLKFLLAVTALSGCDLQPAVSTKPNQELPYRFSGDFQTQVVYRSTLIAIEKHLSVKGDGDVETFFSLGRAYWVRPELAADTGDRFEESVKGLIKRVGISEDGRWLVADSEELSRNTLQPIVHARAVSLSSGQMHLAADIATLQRTVPSAISSTSLEPVELFFDRRMILRVQSMTK
jgi:hypothetical protein